MIFSLGARRHIAQPVAQRGTWGALLAICVLVSALLTAATATPAAAASNASTEVSFVNLLNDYRAQHGLNRLAVSTGARDVARGWSSTMARGDKLYHNPNMVSALAGVAPSYRVVGENVGYGWTVQSLHDAFVNSPPHRENMLGAKYNYIGIGVSQVGTKIWVAVEFVGTPDHLRGINGSPTTAANAVSAKKVSKPRAAAPGSTAAAPVPLGNQLFTQISGGATTVHGFVNSKVHGTVNLGGRSLSAPSPARFGNSTAVAVRGRDNRIWLRSKGKSAWGPWHSLGGKTTHRPGLAGTSSGRLHVLVQGADHALWTKTYLPGHSWGRWVRTGSVITRGPQATGVGSNIVVSAVGRDYAVYLRSLTARGWTGWHRVGGKTYSAAAIISRNGRPLLTVRGTDNRLYYAQLSSPTGVGHWHAVGGRTGAGPGLGSHEGVVSLTVRGTDHRTWTRRLGNTGSRWSPWIRS